MMEPLESYKARIWAGLENLTEMAFPQFRSYRTPDGRWVDREPVSEYIEQDQLQKIWRQIMEYENWFNRCHNPLLISLRLDALHNDLKECPDSVDMALLHRIAISVYQNAPVFGCK